MTNEEKLLRTLRELLNEINIAEHGRSVWLDDPDFSPVLKRARRTLASVERSLKKEQTK